MGFFFFLCLKYFCSSDGGALSDVERVLAMLKEKVKNTEVHWLHG